MAVLADSNTTLTGPAGSTIIRNVATAQALVVYQNIPPKPIPGLSLILLAPVGGIRG